MKILSLWEPWASCMALGHKLWETRGRRINYRGLLAIHAAKNTVAIKDGTPGEMEIDARELCGVNVTFPTTWPLGQIICVVDLYDCVRTEDAKPSSLEEMMGNYSEKRFAWKTRNLRRVKPFPFKGMQGLKPLPPEVEKALEYI